MQRNITYSRLIEVMDYDPQSGLMKWRVANGRRAVIGAEVGTLMEKGYRRVVVDKEFYMVHHLIWLYMTQEWPQNQIDHINGRRDDNRFCNLREASGSQNAWNSKKPATNTSGYKGVSYRKDRSKTARPWMAYIRVNGRKMHLGFYRTAEEAHAAYCAAAIKHYGEFARAA